MPAPRARWAVLSWPKPVAGCLCGGQGASCGAQPPPRLHHAYPPPPPTHTHTPTPTPNPPRWTTYARRVLMLELLWFLLWLVSFNVFTVAFQDEDLSHSLRQLLASRRGRITVAAELLALVGMAPFLLLEGGTMFAYGPAQWLDAWNALDLFTYAAQVWPAAADPRPPCPVEGPSCAVARASAGPAVPPPCNPAWSRDAQRNGSGAPLLPRSESPCATWAGSGPRASC
jgi:hypothetical protein